MLPNDKETLLLLYGRIKNRRSKENNYSMQKNRNNYRDMSPMQQVLLSSVNSRDKLYDSWRTQGYNFASPSNDFPGNKLLVSPEENYEGCRILSEERSSFENVEEISTFQKPKSALGLHSEKRYFSMPRVRQMNKHSRNNSKAKFPRYFRDAAELLVSRLNKQIKKSFDILRQNYDGKLYWHTFIISLN